MKTYRRGMTFAFLFASLVLVSRAPASPAADREFNAIVAKLSQHYQKKPMRFMRLLGFVANRFTPSGVSGLKMAIFEDLQPERQLSGDGIEAFIQSASERGKFLPFVKVRSNRNGGQTFIYAREAGSKFEMLIVSMEKDEAVVMKMRLKPEAMEQWIDEPVHKGRESARGSSRAAAQ